MATVWLLYGYCSASTWEHRLNYLGAPTHLLGNTDSSTWEHRLIYLGTWT
ncbi:MAG: hypothetical protein IKS36_07590 [Bacteroidales bacterium]|nr:hypothetical protein [Bacteroidales bacterium]